MKFDYCIGNPPYQIEVGGGKGSSATAVYDKFVDAAKTITQQSFGLIIPSRWMTGGRGLDSFRESMLHDRHIKTINDYFDASDVFSTADISGGVCMLVWDKNYNGDCKIITNLNGEQKEMQRPLIANDNDVFIRLNHCVDIVNKVLTRKEQKFKDSILYTDSFALPTTVKPKEAQSTERDVYLYAYPKNGYISRDEISKNTDLIDKYKVCISKAYGERGKFPYHVLGKPFVAKPGEVVSASYLILYVTDDIGIAENILSYINTSFFRFLVLQLKNTQHAAPKVYSFVPVQDYSKKITDEFLYKKYGITADEIKIIKLFVKGE